MMARFNLPDIDFVEVDAEELENLAVSKFENLQGVTLTDADPRRKFIQSIAFLGAMLANNIDYTGKQNLLAYASDNYLDHLGAKKNVPRLEPVAATTIFAFEYESPEDFTIAIGSRISIDDLYFYTTEEKTVSAGGGTVEIPAVCEEAGTVGNGFLPGQIKDLVDPLPWISNVYNTVKTDGGIDWEDDDSYADRIRRSNSQYSTAGPEDAYIYHAKSANSLIIDVSVSSPSEGTVIIVPLLEDGSEPDEDVLNQVYEKVSNRTVRPLTDKVIVQKPEEILYDINVTYYVSSEKSNLLPDVQAAVSQAITDYQIWQRSKLGRGIDSSELISLIQAAGGKRVTVTNPSSFIPLSKTQVAKSNLVTVTFGGILDD
ncbi:baseplate J/gp47 family protein [Neobacillus mesonae]|uniref:baseplate assembly protein n=1 Tax=Neobacillus mesonae TaxID=1193713 RepID=UPI00203AED9A|nr:baseplate J/gp47 family protein [Neobacillus mesonae]MCM3567841.1 baseplate J/gp47 family protein [Neobacillus mesonae]